MPEWQKRLDEAIAACEKAIQIAPQFPLSHNNLGAALREKGCLDEAIAAYKRVIELRPDFAEKFFQDWDRKAKL